MEFTIEAMKECHRAPILAMMRTFYASPAVLSNGSEEIFEADIDACVSDNPYLEGFVFCACGELLGYGMAAKSFSTEFASGASGSRICMSARNIGGRGSAAPSWNT